MNFVGSLVFNFIGGCVRYIYGTTWRTIFHKNKFSFREYINGPNESEDYFDKTAHNFINRIVGILTITIILCWIIF